MAITCTVPVRFWHGSFLARFDFGTCAIIERFFFNHLFFISPEPDDQFQNNSYEFYGTMISFIWWLLRPILFTGRRETLPTSRNLCFSEHLPAKSPEPVDRFQNYS